MFRRYYLRVHLVKNRGTGRQTATHGTIDYRLDRRRLLAQYRRGDISETEICDAQLELLRVGKHASVPAARNCPVCEERELRHVQYVFGPRLPKSGRCITSDAELERLAARKGEFRCYLIEVCVRCRWNHLLKSYVLVAFARGETST